MMIDKLTLHKNIEEFVSNSGTDYIDAILHFCTVNNLEIETVGAIISKDQNLMSKLENEAEELHFIKKTARLPI